MAIRQLGRKFTETVARVRHGHPASMVQGWDSQIGLQQGTSRVVPRASMGRKMTPKLGGKMTRK